MLIYARSRTKKDHIKNEDIWKEVNIELMTTFFRQKPLRWYGNVPMKEGKMLCRCRKRKDELKECKMLEDMAEHLSVWHMKTNAGPLWRRPIIGEKKDTHAVIETVRICVIAHNSRHGRYQAVPMNK